MSFRGLFVGIDRYESPTISDLSCARRDATTLDALFADTLGGASRLLTEDQATRANIEAEFAALAGCDPEDTVVIGFSGHGSETHELIPFDADPANLGTTAIPLDLLQDCFTRIPAKRLVFFLDCCFSGGLGSKVLQTEVKPRDLRSAEAKLESIAGNGRLIFTASRADQPAFENTKQGHGFLTLYLIEALRGAEEVVQAARIPIYRLLEHVSARVASAAAQFGLQQHPTMKGNIDGDLHWPVFIEGPRFAAAFPDRRNVTVTSELGSLAAAGFPEQLIASWATAIPSLNSLQVTAINEYGILKGDHLVVSAPTSSGKTMVGELAALRTVLDRRRAIFLLPLKALVADKRRHFNAVYGPFGIRTIEATGETDDISPILRGKYDIALLTYEKFAAIALTFPHVLAGAGVIVVDEAQMIADKGRGANLEFLLTLIRMRRREGIEPQTIALSAVIGDTNGLESWLGGRLLRQTERPVPLDEGVLRGDGTFRFIDSTNGQEKIEGPIIRQEYRKGSSQDWVVPLVRHLVGQGQQVIVFREVKGEARGTAGYLAESIGLPPARTAMDRLPIADASLANQDLRKAMAGGVAFHHADLTPEERRVVEEEFRRPNSGLRVIAATTTLAMGVNTPASSVVIVGLMHPVDQPYSVAEYKNLVGRAGRLGFSEKGSSYILATDGHAEYGYWSNYVTKTPEDLASRFLDDTTDARSLIVRVVTSLSRLNPKGVGSEAIVEFLEASFGAFQAARTRSGWNWDRNDLLTALQDLERNGLLLQAEGLYTLTDLGRLAGESATEVTSIVRLVECLRKIPANQLTDPNLIAATQITSELDDLGFPINKKSTQKEPQAWIGELRPQVSGAVLNAFQRELIDNHTATIRAKKSVSCLMFVSGRPMSKIEKIIGQFGGAFGGASGPIRSVANRTSDLVTTTAKVAQILHPDLDLGDRVGKLVLRLTHGIPGAATDLARECGSELLRGEYCALVNANVCEAEAIEAASDAAILDCVGGNREKLSAIRDAAAAMKRRKQAMMILAAPILEPYVA
ncbi:DEAD/DEAH box helicase [Nitrobacter winogradskyi]|uniref:Replicative superfamily II helicase n=2 Tax=Nitrobacter winogradskyi TaxID=913 RepID=A0ACC6ANW4_NITWI|nr:DEAD/DEAH box helicase [Nitrobacter winogradskyi]MCP2001394.1 replicative superfamily II helicase [Nitrobacter winogradskyi]GEC15440.1 peptidase C14 [Nitrobacter winogradskyi]